MNAKEPDIEKSIKQYLASAASAPSLEFPLGKPVKIPTEGESMFLEAIERPKDLLPGQFDSIRKSVSVRQGYDLVIFAVRMAVLAARKGRPSYLRKALLGLVVDDDAVDYRDVLRAVAIIEDCALRLRIDLLCAIVDCCSLASPKRRELIMKGYFERPPQLKGIGVMGFTASGELDTLDFAQS